MSVSGCWSPRAPGLIGDQGMGSGTFETRREQKFYNDVTVDPISGAKQDACQWHTW